MRLLIILVAIPLIEIAILIKVGQWIGFWPVVGLVIGTFGLGALVLGRIGVASAVKVREALSRGEPPVGALLDSALLVVAALLLITPGFIADVAGLALLLPPLRRALAGLAIGKAIVVGGVRFGRPGRDRGSVHPDAEPQPGRRQDDGGPVIEGEFERLDERPLGSRRRPRDRNDES